MDFLKSVGGKIVSGLVALAVIATGISWYEMDAATRQTLVHGAGHILAWAGLVLAVPWASFFLIGAVARRDSNAAGGLLVAGYTTVEAVVLAWLFSWGVKGATAVVFFCAAVLFAGVYNLFTCDWIAEKIS